jgi:hypothetical protein
VELLLAIVNVDEQVGLQEALEKAPLAPDGSPETEKVTA